jgi:NADH-quinone oxidoreductase subunit C
MPSSGGTPTDPADSPAVLGARLAGLVSGAVASVSGGGVWSRATIDVPPHGWPALVIAARDELACDFFDWLSAVDELDAGFAVVAHVWSTGRRYGVLMRTRIPRGAPNVASIVDIYPGAAWPERETHEMFDIDFVGHPNLAPLLLPPEFEGHPLRKDFVLASRVAKAWPGAVEPGESGEPSESGESRATAAPRRAPMRPPGVPDPGQWGPDAGCGGGGELTPAER